MRAKDALRKVHELNKAVSAAIVQAESLRSDVERTTQIYGAIHVDGGRADHDAKLHRLMAAQKKCNAINDYYIDYKTMIIDRINLLETADHRRILTAVYIATTKDGLPLSWEEIAAQVNYSVRQAQRLHGEALLAFAAVMPTDEDVARCRGMSYGDLI